MKTPITITDKWIEEQVAEFKKRFCDKMKPGDALTPMQEYNLEQFQRTALAAAFERGESRGTMKAQEEAKQIIHDRSWKRGAAAERERWIHQPANQHDERIRAQERIQIFELLHKHFMGSKNKDVLDAIEAIQYEVLSRTTTPPGEGKEISGMAI